jgi:hypothetical protein
MKSPAGALALDTLRRSGTSDRNILEAATGLDHRDGRNGDPGRA